ncbi:hypothetical protein D9756_006933 [Leucocoprinus leucothites]|uniref:Uncharacterized protein n=1 Tax=Leucocoprinus leucothites TaxID=201217 RepID=A0A8H5D6C8_9AGAR|nr:hypothetical protein D9756_006933 [Leucoagaricus leucothites]
MAGFLRKKSRNDAAKNQAISSPTPPQPQTPNTPLFSRFATSTSSSHTNAGNGQQRVVVSGPMTLSAGARRDNVSVHSGRHGPKNNAGGGADPYTAFRRTSMSPSTSQMPTRAPQAAVEASGPQAPSLPSLPSAPPNLEFDPQGRHSPLIDLPPEIALFQVSLPSS